MKSKEKYAQAIIDLFTEISCLGGFNEFAWIAGKVYCDSIDKAVREEREQCALIADTVNPEIAAIIRSRK